MIFFFFIIFSPLSSSALARDHPRAHQSIPGGSPLYTPVLGWEHGAILQLGHCVTVASECGSSQNLVRFGVLLCLVGGSRRVADPGRGLTLSCLASRWRTVPSTSWRPSTPCRSTPGWQISRTASTPGKAHGVWSGFPSKPQPPSSPVDQGMIWARFLRCCPSQLWPSGPGVPVHPGGLCYNVLV